MDKTQSASDVGALNRDVLIAQLKNLIGPLLLTNEALEHIEKRIEFLRKILLSIKPRRLIIRVPLFERDWKVPLKKELGVDYRLDPTHYIEYTQEEYFKELYQAGLKATSTEFKWVKSGVWLSL